VWEYSQRGKLYTPLFTLQCPASAEAGHLFAKQTSFTYAYDDYYADVFYVCASTSCVSYASFRLA